MELIELPVSTGEGAIRALRELFLPAREEIARTGHVASAAHVDAIWLGADPQLIDVPVLQFVLQLQIQRELPVIAATRSTKRRGPRFSRADRTPLGLWFWDLLRLAAGISSGLLFVVIVSAMRTSP